MPIVDLLDDEEYSEAMRRLDDEGMAAYSSAPEMSPFVKATGHFFPVLEPMCAEQMHVMPTDELSRKLSEFIAIATSMVNGCRYCIVAHDRIVREFYDDVGDPEIAELAATVAHVTGLNHFEIGALSGTDPLFEPVSPEEVPLLEEIAEELGVLPTYYQVMARDPEFLRIIWDMERAVMQSGNLTRREKGIVAFAVSITNHATDAVKLRKRMLTEMGVTEDELFEALMIVEIYNKDNTWTTGLDLEPELWEREW